MKYFIIGLIVTCLGLGAYVGHLNDNINDLSKSLDNVIEENKRIAKDVQRLDGVYSDRAENKVKTEKAATKFRKDSKREAVVVAKPQLVENQINKSFNKMATELSEATK